MLYNINNMFMQFYNKFERLGGHTSNTRLYEYTLRSNSRLPKNRKEVANIKFQAWNILIIMLMNF